MRERFVMWLKVGNTVRHRDEPELGEGRVVATLPREKIALVMWDVGIQRRHIESALVRVIAK